MPTKITLYLFLLILLPVFGHAQQKFSAKVRVYVQLSESSTMQDVISSYITRNIRSLRDVEVVSDGEDYAIEAVVVPITAGGRINGYAISVNYFKTAKCTYNDKYFDGSPLIEKCDSLIWNSAVVSSPDALRENAEIIVAKFDTKVLEYYRNFFRENKSLRP
jgi:hypothetical protein